VTHAGVNGRASAVSAVLERCRPTLTPEMARACESAFVSSGCVPRCERRAPMAAEV
jgi:hypothetical protein